MPAAYDLYTEKNIAVNCSRAYVKIEARRREDKFTSRKKITPKDYFDKNNADFIKFGDKFVEQLTDEKLITELAQKDLEKLAKVWKLVFELLADNSKTDPNEKLTELIGIYSDLKNDTQ